MTTVSKNSIPDDIERENEILKKNIAELQRKLNDNMVKLNNKIMFSGVM